MNKQIFCAAACIAVCASSSALADGTRADSHAPIGVMGDHVHGKGEWMFSYRFMTMDMENNIQGTDRIDADTIVTTEPNVFFGNPGQPPTLRIVPLEMTMDMHMLGMMYAPTDRLTLMLMTNYIDKDMSHVTYVGGMGTTALGNFSTSTSGWGDTSISGLWSFINSAQTKLHATVGVSIPTGSTDETGQILTPMDMRPVVRLPYPMQLGSGSYDPILGLTYTGFSDGLSWGAQWRSVFRSGDNDDDYQLGDETRLTAWISYLATEPASVSLRVEHYDRSNISGMDPMIMGPVQTADPNRQDLSRTDIGIGMNIAGQHGLDGWRFAIEYLFPVDQDAVGPQLETDSQLMIGIQKAW